MTEILLKSGITQKEIYGSQENSGIILKTHVISKELPSRISDVISDHLYMTEILLKSRITQKEIYGSQEIMYCQILPKPLPIVYTRQMLQKQKLIWVCTVC